MKVGSQQSKANSRQDNWLLHLFSLLFAILLLSGCGTEIDLYGESRIDPESTDRAIKQLQEQQTTETYIKIIPPAVINPKNIEDTDPRLLTIDFQDGFNGIFAQVIYQDKVIFNERLLSNRYGYADTASFVYLEEPVSFTIRFPTMGEETFTVDPADGRFFGLAIRGSQLVVTFQENPFFYPN